MKDTCIYHFFRFSDWGTQFLCRVQNYDRWVCGFEERHSLFSCYKPQCQLCTRQNCFFQKSVIHFIAK